MADPALTLAQWFSPAFPVGAFAYSHGMETLIAQGNIHCAQSLAIWLEDIARHGAGQSDLVLMAAAFNGDVDQAEAIARALCPSAERLQETSLQGAAFVRTVNPVWGLDLPALTYPVAIGAAAKACALPLDLAARLYLHAMLSNLVSVGIRLIPLGQTDGQHILHRLKPQIEIIAAEAIATPLSAISSASFAADIASMQHETLQPRIFRT